MIATDYEKSYGLDKTPGILFYDNEFRTPSLLFWNVYYNTACGYIDKNILD